MDDRFANLSKVIPQPAARLMALSNARYEAPVTSPAAADVATVLRELDAAERFVEMIRLLAVALPVREGVWWACLAGRDVLAEGARAPRTLTTAEAWAFEPSDARRQAARDALDAADPDDPTMLCAMAAAMCDGTLGPGELAQYEAPAGGAQTAVFGMNVLALAAHEDDAFRWLQVLIERGLDIARGGNGTIDPAAVVARPPAPEPDDDDDDDEDDDDDDEDDDAATAAEDPSVGEETR